MIIIASGRKTSRTTRLIEMCAEAEAAGEVSYIVARHHQHAWNIAQKAKELGLTIGFPLTFEEFLIGKQHSRFIKNFFIDDADLLLQSMTHSNVKAITVLKEPELEDQV